MSKETADIVGSAGAKFTLTVSAGDIHKATLEAGSQADLPLAFVGNVITIPSLPEGDSQVELGIFWGPGDTGATIDVGSGTPKASDPKPTIDSSSPVAFVELFGESAQ
jgi:hypothetical protein